MFDLNIAFNLMLLQSVYNIYTYVYVYEKSMRIITFLIIHLHSSLFDNSNINAIFKKNHMFKNLNKTKKQDQLEKNLIYLMF